VGVHREFEAPLGGKQRDLPGADRGNVNSPVGNRFVNGCSRAGRKPSLVIEPPDPRMRVENDQ
jgi:hypothetical protein